MILFVKVILCSLWAARREYSLVFLNGKNVEFNYTENTLVGFLTSSSTELTIYFSQIPIIYSYYLDVQPYE